MVSDEHYKKLERMYTTAPCNEYYRPTLRVREGATELIIPIQEKFFHAAGATHGSVYFKALDDAAFFAVNSLVEDVFVLTIQFNIYFVRPISSGEMRAVGRVLFSSHSFFNAESVLFNSRGEEIARGSGMFTRSNIPLSEKLGYG